VTARPLFILITRDYGNMKVAELTSEEKEFLKTPECMELLKKNDFDTLYKLISEWAHSIDDKKLSSKYSNFFYNSGIQLENYLHTTYPELFTQLQFNHTPVFHVDRVVADCFNETLFKKGFVLDADFIGLTGIHNVKAYGDSVITVKQFDLASIYKSQFHHLNLLLDASNYTQKQAIHSCSINRLDIALSAGSFDHAFGLFFHCFIGECYVIGNKNDYLAAIGLLQQGENTYDNVYFNGEKV